MIVAIANQKGGVGKTTTVANLAIALGQRGFRVLAVDLDPQASLTFYLGYDETELEECRRTLYHAIFGEAGLEAVLIPGSGRGPDLLPASITLAKAETELLSEPNGSLVLKELLEPLRPRYDIVLIDCPPSLGMLTVNALNAANGVVIPVKTQLLSLIGLTQILETIRKIRRRANPQLRVLGILPTMHHARHAHDGEVLREIHKHYGELRIFDPIPNTTRLARVAGAGGSGSSDDETGSAAPPSLGHEAYARIAVILTGEAHG
jgi:chromosome partitioning protein